MKICEKTSVNFWRAKKGQKMDKNQISTYNQQFLVPKHGQGTKKKCCHITTLSKVTYQLGISSRGTGAGWAGLAIVYPYFLLALYRKLEIVHPFLTPFICKNFWSCQPSLKQPPTPLSSVGEDELVPVATSKIRIFLCSH